MDKDKTIDDFNKLVEKYDSMKKRDLMDLSSDQDLVIAIMNLIGIEEHLFFTGAKTGKNEYFDLIQEVRSIRKELLKKVIIEYEGEVWCISKHLLASSYRLMEVGTKQMDLGNKEEAYELFEKSYNLYTLFWGLVMKVIPVAHAKTIKRQMIGEKTQEEVQERIQGNPQENSGGMMGKFKELLKKVVNCCIE